MIRRTLKRQEAASFLGQSSSQRQDKSRFTDPRLAGDDDDLASATFCLAVLLLQQAQLGLTSDKGRQVQGSACFKTARCRSRCQNPPYVNWSLESLYGMITEIAEFEQASKQTPSSRSHQYLAGLGQGLQARRQIRSVTHQGKLARGALTNQVADNYETACNTNSYLEPFSDRDHQSRDGLNDLKRSLYRALGIILVSGRETEISENSIAHQACNVSLVAADRVCTTPLKFKKD